jgi:DNA polymerase I
MRHHIFEESEQYKVALLIKETSFYKQELVDAYVTPLTERGIPARDIIAFTLSYKDNKASAAHIKDYLAKLLPALTSLNVTHLYVADSAYFKVLARKPKAEPHLGYALPCGIKGFEHLTVVLGVNYRQLIYNPEIQPKLDLSLQALATHLQGSYQALGQGIIHSAHYPQGSQEILAALGALHHHPSLSCDIEAFSLRFNEAGIGTIAFAWDQHNGIAFPVDYVPVPTDSETSQGGSYGRRETNSTVRGLLRVFFETYQGELTFHNAGYDVKVLIAQLWMQDLLDTAGLLRGLDLMARHWHDTKIIAYLATNSTAGNVLGLKSLAHEFAGNWAVEEIKDILRVPLDKLLQYNLVDALSTHYVRAKYEPVMEADQQGELYRTLMMPTQKMLLQVELTGLPINVAQVQAVKAELLEIQKGHLDTIQKSPTVQAVNRLLQISQMEKANAKLKLKRHPLEKFADTVLNPNSPNQLQRLLYEVMGLPVIDLTDTKQPATGAETVEKLINHVTDPDHKTVMEALIGYSTVSKILSTFIPAFEQAIVKDDSGIAWLHGNFNLGGTVSGRLSSSDPNLQNLPAGGTGSKAKQYYGKLIKSCVMAPSGMLYCGADFNSLEDYISALTTRDPNKLAVYERGFDGHCLRAAYYFRDQLLHIDLAEPTSVNSIKKSHPELRQESKTPTFALTYQGTFHTLMSNLGWSEEKAKQIEASYHELYKVSDQYVQAKLAQASKDGYVTVAFGLRVRTPLLSQVIFGADKMPYEAAAEGRTAGNALGQSYGLLNNRAAMEFMQKVWASPYRLDIRPVALIHDAIYILVKDDVDVVHWANRELIASMRWQELPEIKHPTVKLGAALDIFWPSWANPTTLPNDATPESLITLCAAAKQELMAA